ncbi:hypothetical protein JR316_0007344 [Psilocybe cubensis]|uniref:Uncharacterized protein n=1 Tax=Psilocybe cubensis TaxID=181762 RepID=A0ACB8GYT2_PSICU|nr:hypothetical protein JR316_0007344 [Psilocybe cubensis]KAH9480744.1 hypothetical protein JR316_0007344 [Psilocybe cubensis]
MYSTGWALFLYNVTLIINAPFGRFTPKDQSSIFLVDGVKSWILMELVSPFTFIYTFLTSPLSVQAPPLPSLTEPHAILALCFLIHYTNRALVNPLRTSSRSKAHLIVTLSGVTFNILNGCLMGSYLSSPFARIYLAAGPRSSFYVGLTLWVLGLAGNIWHDEILLDIRRKAKSKGKSKVVHGMEVDGSRARTEHYAIPHGGLYSLISYPNYFCEWIEWFGFALAAAPFPFQLSHLKGFTFALVTSKIFDPQTYTSILKMPAQNFAPDLSPPWIFLLTEIVLMLPRAYRGHQWYHEKFRDSYPQSRKAVIPFIL